MANNERERLEKIIFPKPSWYEGSPEVYDKLSVVTMRELQGLVEYFGRRHVDLSLTGLNGDGRLSMTGTGAPLHVRHMRQLLAGDHVSSLKIPGFPEQSTHGLDYQIEPVTANKEAFDLRIGPYINVRISLIRAKRR